jgi:cysteine synthase A
MEKKELSVFEGEEAIKEFLNPENLPYPPLVELPKEMNPYASDGVRIFGKLMFLTPLLNLKSYPAFNMLQEAKVSGGLDGIERLVESSSGNLVFSLGIIARTFGITQTAAVVSRTIAKGKLDLLRLAGLTPFLADESETKGSNHEAAEMGRKKAWKHLNQYGNEANFQAHEKWLARQIDEQTGGELGAVSAGLGSTGTIIGLSRYLRCNGAKTKIVGVIRQAGQPVPGVRTDDQLREVTLQWQGVADYIARIDSRESFSKSLELVRHGIMGGPSSGFALAGLSDFLSKAKSKETLDELRGKNGEIKTVFICGDTPLPYINDYFAVLGEDVFPEVKEG